MYLYAYVWMHMHRIQASSRMTFNDRTRVGVERASRGFLPPLHCSEFQNENLIIYEVHNFLTPPKVNVTILAVYLHVCIALHSLVRIYISSTLWKSQKCWIRNINILYECLMRWHHKLHQESSGRIRAPVERHPLCHRKTPHLTGLSKTLCSFGWEQTWRHSIFHRNISGSVGKLRWPWFPYGHMMFCYLKGHQNGMGWSRRPRDWNF